MVEYMEQEGKSNVSESDVIATGAVGSIAEPASQSEEGREEEVIRKLSAPASEESSEARSPDPDDSTKGAATSDLFEAAVDDLAFFAAAATGRSHSDAWSPSQQHRSGRLPFSPVFPLDEEEKEGESKGADDGGGGLRSTEEQELIVFETGGEKETVDGELLGELKSESIPAEEGNDCAVGGVAAVATSPSPCGDSSVAIGGVSSVPAAVDAGDMALTFSTSEGTTSDLIGGGGVGGEPMSVDVTMAVEASGAGSSSLPSPGLDIDSGVNMEDEVTVAVEERGETETETDVVCEEVEETVSCDAGCSPCNCRKRLCISVM